MEHNEIEKGKVLTVSGLTEYKHKSVTTKVILQRNTGSIVAHAFDEETSLVDQSVPFDRFVFIIHGSASIQFDESTFLLNVGQAIIIPAHKASRISAPVQCGMTITVIKSGYEE